MVALSLCCKHWQALVNASQLQACTESALVGLTLPTAFSLLKAVEVSCRLVLHSLSGDTCSLSGGVGQVANRQGAAHPMTLLTLIRD